MYAAISTYMMIIPSTHLHVHMNSSPTWHLQTSPNTLTSPHTYQDRTLDFVIRAYIISEHVLRNIIHCTFRTKISKFLNHFLKSLTMKIDIYPLLYRGYK